MNQSPISLLLLLVLSLSLSIGTTCAQEKPKRKQPTFSWSKPVPREQLTRMGLPEQLVHRTFKSPSMGIEVGYFIYLPSAYEKDSERAFPVVFHLHGGRPGGEGKSIKLASFVHEAIESEKIQPTIYVWPNGGPMSWYNYPQIENGQGEDVFVKELIPHIRETYRTRELAIEGFSQGGRGTTRIMFRHPELFVSAAPGGSGYEPEKRIQENDGAESERVVFASGYNAWDLATEYAGRPDKDKLPILIWVGTKCFNYEFNLKFSEYLESLEIPHDLLVVEEVDHSAVRTYEKKGDELMQFHQQSFAAPE